MAPEVHGRRSQFESAYPRTRAALLGLLLVGLVGLGGYWAGRATVGGSAVPDDLGRSALTADVTTISVGRELTLNVSTSRRQVPLAVNTLSGVVTEVAPSSQISTGEVLYVVGGVPVRAVDGATPFYRTLRMGTQGDDVRQLRDALVAIGFAATSGTVFDADTQTAVRLWQEELGIRQSGMLRLGELVAVPDLPSRVEIDRSLAFSGALLSGGETLLFGPRGEPQFSLVVSAEQARLIPETARVTIPTNGGRWRAVIAGSTHAPGGQVRFRLTAPDGGPVCGGSCDTLTDSQSSILSRVAIVPEVSGSGLPVAAISTAADGTTSVQVVEADGLRKRVVEVVASQDGVAVVRGVEVGEEVQVFSGSGADSLTPGPSAQVINSPSGHASNVPGD